jgi:hypothetical protein
VPEWSGKDGASGSRKFNSLYLDSISRDRACHKKEPKDRWPGWGQGVWRAEPWVPSTALYHAGLKSITHSAHSYANLLQDTEIFTLISFCVQCGAPTPSPASWNGHDGLSMGGEGQPRVTWEPLALCVECLSSLNRFHLRSAVRGERKSRQVEHMKEGAQPSAMCHSGELQVTGALETSL